MRLASLFLAILFVFSLGFVSTATALTVGEFVQDQSPQGDLMENNLPAAIYLIPLPDTFPDTGGGTDPTDPGLP